LVREGKLTKGQYLKAKDDLLLDLVDVAICDLDAQVTSKAIQCLEQSVLRAMDVIPIACALTLLADCFLTADKRQHEAALLAGLSSVLVE
jgi:predicted nucleic acid-binding protein